MVLSVSEIVDRERISRLMFASASLRLVRETILFICPVVELNHDRPAIPHAEDAYREPLTGRAEMSEIYLVSRKPLSDPGLAKTHCSSL